MSDVSAVPTPDRNDENFWTAASVLVEPPWSEPAQSDTFTMDERIHEAARDLAERISTRVQAYRAADKSVDPVLMAAPDVQLALLRALHEAKQSVERLAESAATVAGRSGANYAQLGAAWGGIKRQSARLKWPHAVVRKTTSESIPLQYAGGAAVVHHDADADAWWYTATGGDRQEAESEPVHRTYAEAIAGATEYLLAHSLPDRQAPA
ncbi:MULTISPECIES: hypothetical protein [unclassified Streptomyces]|uniref:hypothetical protein n=1 Tax=unclassified Streptomyces TaxID=2593676 RepID=UPI0029665A6D|nr:hypothetical protein [Streptomyces sp. SJL17-1]